MSGGVCVVGSCMYDLVVRSARRPQPGETVVGESFETFLGGKGFNQAVAAQRAGAATSFIGRVGQDEFGRQFLGGLAVEGLDHHWVVTDAALGTGVGLPVVEPGGQNSIIIVPQANSGITPEQIEASAGAITGADVLLLQLEVPLEASLAAARVAAEAGVLVVVNPAPYVPLPAELLHLADVLVPNEVELAAMASIDDDPEQALAALQSRTEAQIVATLGGRGVLVSVGRASTSLVPAHRVTAVDTVGAGDVFCGYLAAGLAAGEELIEAVTRANAAAALSVTRHGGATSAPVQNEVVRFMASVSADADGHLLSQEVR